MVEHLRSLGWLIQPSKLQGIPEPLERIHALGTLISFPDQEVLSGRGQVAGDRRHHDLSPHKNEMPGSLLVSPCRALDLPGSFLRARLPHENTFDVSEHRGSAEAT